jgi:serpin B
MKRFWAFLLSTALAGTPGGAHGAGPSATNPPANYDAFGIALLRRLVAAAPGRNVFISPLSIGVALSMVADGAASATRSSMFQTLQMPPADSSQRNAALLEALRTNTDAQIGVANAIWLRHDIPPERAYVDNLARNYGAQAQAVRFGDPSAADAINAWTKEHTLRLIDRIVDRTSPYDFAFLTNALAFDAKWTLPFKKSATHQAPFTDAAGHARNVDMMTNTASYAETDATNLRAVRMAYGKGGYAAYILLPRDRKPEALLQQLDAAGFNRIAQSMHDVRLQLSVPRFTARYDASLVPALRALGMGVAFSDAADFSRMHPPPPQLRISSVRHASYVRVDEAGTVAAAATSAGISMTAIEVPQVTFVVDRPFVFAIRDERAGVLLFLGVINEV